MTILNLYKGGTNYEAPIVLPPGSVTNPPLQFSNASIGVYQVGTASIGFAIGGVNVGTLSAAGLTLLGTISAAAGAFTFTTITANAITGGDGTLEIAGLDGGGIVSVTGGGNINANAGNVSLTGGAATGLLGAGNGGSADMSFGAGNASGVPGTITFQANPNIIFPTYQFTGTPAATDAVFFVATRPMVVKSVSQVHSVAAGGTSTLTVIKDTGTAAPGAGTVIQTGSFNLNATANTVQSGTLAAAAATLTMAAGDRLSVKFANSIQSSAGIVVTVGLMPG